MRAIARIVCWNCRQGNKQLYNVRDNQGKKTEDYVCVDCRPLGQNPPIGNMSKQYFPTDEQVKSMLALVNSEPFKTPPLETPPVVAIEGDRVT